MTYVEEEGVQVKVVTKGTAPEEGYVNLKITEEQARMAAENASQINGCEMKQKRQPLPTGSRIRFLNLG